IFCTYCKVTTHKTIDCKKSDTKSKHIDELSDNSISGIKQIINEYDNPINIFPDLMNKGGFGNRTLIFWNFETFKKFLSKKLTYSFEYYTFTPIKGLDTVSNIIFEIGSFSFNNESIILNLEYFINLKKVFIKFVNDNS